MFSRKRHGGAKGASIFFGNFTRAAAALRHLLHRLHALRGAANDGAGKPRAATSEQTEEPRIRHIRRSRGRVRRDSRGVRGGVSRASSAEVSRHRGVGGEGDGVDEAVRYHRRADTAVEREGAVTIDQRGGGGERGTAVRLDANLDSVDGMDHEEPYHARHLASHGVRPRRGVILGARARRHRSDGIRRATFVPSLPTETNMRTKTRAERRGMREALTDDPPTARTGAVTGTSTLLK